MYSYLLHTLCDDTIKNLCRQIPTIKKETLKTVTMVNSIKKIDDNSIRQLSNKYKIDINAIFPNPYTIKLAIFNMNKTTITVNTLNYLAKNLELQYIYDKYVQIPYCIKSLITYLQKKGIVCAIASSGLDYFVKPIAKYLFIDDYLANTSIYKDNKLIGNLHKPVVNSKKKADFLFKLCQKYKKL